MKTNVTLPVLMLMLIFQSVSAQPDYSFKNPTRLSGTNLQQGTVYLFEDVKPGVDARMTLSFISPGVTLTQLDGGSGYPETLQPTVQITPWTNGYVEMTIEFRVANGSAVSVQPLIAATCIDVDGVTNYDGQHHNLHEFDQINMGGGYTDFNTVGGELSISQDGNWFTGTNIAAVDYPGRDTSAKAVMFSVINNNVSSMIVRVGINNQTATAATRERSVYFKRFVYPNSFLAFPSTPQKLKRGRKSDSENSFKVYPTNIRSSAKIAVTASEGGLASFEVVDYSGRTVMQQKIVVNKGNNEIPFLNTSRISDGSYVAVLKVDGNIYNQKIIKQ